MKNKKDKCNDGFYDIHNELIKHKDVVKVIRVNENNAVTNPCIVGKFYKVQAYDENNGGLLCLVINKTGTLHPMFYLEHVDFEIKK